MDESGRGAIELTVALRDAQFPLEGLAGSSENSRADVPDLPRLVSAYRRRTDPATRRTLKAYL